MATKKWVITFTFLLNAVSAVASTAPRMTVYTTHNYPITRAELAHQVYYIDEVENWEEQISRSFSLNPNQAQQQALQIFAQPQWQKQEQQLKNAYEGVLSGWQNGIKKVPAILFQAEGQENAVIYGETNVERALKLWQRQYAQP